MAELITITQTGGHIVFTNAKGTDQVISVPKENLTILKRTTKEVDASEKEYVYLNWPAGGQRGGRVFHRDDYKLSYLDIVSPTVASNVALETLLRTWAADVDVNVDVTSIDTNSLIGKATTATNADFTTAYLAATTITLSNYPLGITGFIGDDIETVRQINALGDVVMTYSRDDVRMEVAANVLTVTGATFALTDTFIVYTNVPRDTTIEPDLEFTSNYTGKFTGGNGDFDISYTSAITLTVDTFPAGITALVAADVGLIRQTTLAGAWVADYTPANSTITMVGAVITIAEAALGATDILVLFTTVARSAAAGGSSEADYKIASWDGTVTYASTTTLTLAGAYPTINYDAQIVYIRRVNSTTNTASVYVNGQSGTVIEHAGGVLTISGAGTPFLVTDAYEVGINATPVGNDLDLDLIKTGVQNPDYAHYTTAKLITAIDLAEAAGGDGAGGAGDNFYYLIDMQSYKDASFTFISTTAAGNTFTIDLYGTDNVDAVFSPDASVDLLPDGITDLVAFYSGVTQITVAASQTEQNDKWIVTDVPFPYLLVQVLVVDGGTEDNALDCWVSKKY